MSAVDDMAAPLLGPTDVARGASGAGPDLEAGGGQRLGHASLPHKLDLAAFRKSSGDLQVRGGAQAALLPSSLQLVGLLRLV